MSCCKAGCPHAAVYMGMCVDHAIDYRRRYPHKARKHDIEVSRTERAGANVYGKEAFARLKEKRHATGQGT